MLCIRDHRGEKWPVWAGLVFTGVTAVVLEEGETTGLLTRVVVELPPVTWVSRSCMYR